MFHHSLVYEGFTYSFASPSCLGYSTFGCPYLPSYFFSFLAYFFLSPFFFSSFFYSFSSYSTATNGMNSEP